jgi:hypothetical protein
MCKQGVMCTCAHPYGRLGGAALVGGVLQPEARRGGGEGQSSMARGGGEAIHGRGRGEAQAVAARGVARQRGATLCSASLSPAAEDPLLHLDLLTVNFHQPRVLVIHWFRL